MSCETNIHQYDIGDGKMEYIQDIYTRELLTDAWKAVTLTNNWDFVYQNTISFAWKNDNINYEILQKMGESKSYYLKTNFEYSYRILMRYMNYLARNGEQKFAIFVNKLTC